MERGGREQRENREGGEMTEGKRERGRGGGERQEGEREREKEGRKEDILIKQVTLPQDTNHYVTTIYIPPTLREKSNVLLGLLLSHIIKVILPPTLQHLHHM